jgi:hypothetical protein
MAEIRQEHYRRRAVMLGKWRKDVLCSLYRELGGMGGIAPRSSGARTR